MQANSYTPYVLKDMYQTIDLIDRKIASSQSWETFESQDAREAHLRKLSTKRAALVKTALALTNLGVHSDPKFLPRSFVQAVPEETIPLTSSSVAMEAEKKFKKPANIRKRKS